MTTFLSTLFASGTAAGSVVAPSALVPVSTAVVGPGIGTTFTIGAQTFTTVAPGLATVAPAAAGAGITAGEIIAGSLAGFGALSSVQSARFAAAASERQAVFEDIRAREEAVIAKQQANDIREQLLRNLAQQDAAASGAGIDITSGTIMRGKREAVAQANRELGITERSGLRRRLARSERARQLRIEARAQRIGGVGRATFGLLDFVDRTQRRGRVPARA